MERFFANPEALRLIRTKLRPRNLLFLGSATVLALGILLTALYYLQQSSTGYPYSQMFKDFFFTVVWLQFGVLSLYGLIQASMAISQEKERFTFDFQRLVAMGPGRLVLGKLMGSACDAWFIVFCGVPFLFVPVLAGFIPLAMLLTILPMLLLFGLSITSMGLFVSSLVDKTQRASGLATMIPVLMAAFHVAYAATNTSGFSVWETFSPFVLLIQLREQVINTTASPRFYLYGAAVPLLAGYAVWHLALTLLCFKLTVRRLEDEEFSFLKPIHAFAILTLLNFVLLGDYIGRNSVPAQSAIAQSQVTIAINPPPAQPNDQPATGEPVDPPAVVPVTPPFPPNLPPPKAPVHPIAFHVTNFAVLLMLAFGLVPSGELLRSRLHRSCRNRHWPVLFEIHNRRQDAPGLTPMALLAGFYVCTAVLLSVYEGVFNQRALAAILLVAGSGLATLGLLLCLQLYLRQTGLRAGAGLVVVLLVFPPLIMALFTLSWLPSLYVNPIAWLVVLNGDPDLNAAARYTEGVGVIWTVPLIALAAALLFPVLAAMRMRFLLDLYALEIEREQARASETANTQATPRTPAAAAQALEKMAAHTEPVPPLMPPASAPAEAQPEPQTAPKIAVEKPLEAPPLVPEIKLRATPHTSTGNGETTAST